MSARNPLIVRADICGFSARSSAEKVKFSVSCTVYARILYIHTHILYNIPIPITINVYTFVDNTSESITKI